ncbi:MAG: hypothetical protein IJF84_13540 [Thermoguttaceae bacterium]|nr:hypothetical protein [Thermoguttaceae bacterium]
MSKSPKSDPEQIQRSLTIAEEITKLINWDDWEERQIVGKALHYYICDALAHFYKVSSGNDTGSELFMKVHLKVAPGRREALAALRKIEEILLRQRGEKNDAEI